MKIAHVILLILYFVPENMKGELPLTPLTPFQWNSIMPTAPVTTPGNQIFHFGGKNKPFENNEKAVEFVNSYLSDATAYQSDAEVLRAASDAVSINGFYLEMGVATGRTINFIAGLNPLKKIYGFDSFEGLPKDWDRDDKTHPAGTFAFDDKNFVPPVLKNVELYKGWFKNTLPAFKAQKMGDQAIAFLHIDSDIYEAARDVFMSLGDRIVPGTVIVFDELYNYPGFERHEWKAFQEFLSSSGYKSEYIAYNRMHEQVAVKIVERKE